MTARVAPTVLPPSARPVRVGFVVHVMQVAGAEVLVRETIRRLGAAIAPTVFCLDRVGQIGEDLVEEGVDLVCLDRKPGWDFTVSRRLAAEARARGVEVLHAHQYTPFFYAALAKPLVRPMPKLILTEHGRHYPDVVSTKRRAFNRVVLDRLADAVNACCRFSAEALCRVDGFSGRRIEVIENGIEAGRYEYATDRAEARRGLGWPPDRGVVIHVARHHPVKDQATLLRGFALAAGGLPDVDLVMVGDGPLRPQLEQLAADLGVRERVRFLGIRSDIPRLLGAADVFALTSVSEAASLTVLEAMATGLPVVVTAVGGNPEMVRHEEEGLLVPRGDPAACAAAFRLLFDDPDFADQLGRAARDRVHERYRLEQTVHAYHTLYRRLVGR